MIDSFLQNYHDVPTLTALKSLIGSRIVILTPNITYSKSSENLQGTVIVGHNPQHKKSWYAKIWTDTNGLLIRVE